ncbi:MAG: heavy metal-associated domain-containing protein [Planctomycetota bacterium]|jgi:copper chaperone
MNRRLRIQITGMHCDHCVRAVEEALSSAPGVRECRVEIGSAEVTFDDAAAKKSDLPAVIRRAGKFDVASISQIDPT